jgi:hypothetical protein
MTEKTSQMPDVVDLTIPGKIDDYLDSPVIDLKRVAYQKDALWMRNLRRHRQPAIIEGMVDAWPALRRWSLPFFSERARGIFARIDIGNVLQRETKWERVDVGDFIGQVESLSYENGSVPYLVAFPLLEHFPELAADVDFSEFKRGMIDTMTTCAIGPAGTVTGFHYDLPDNLFVQILGRKEFLFVSPSDRHRMYRSKKFDPGAVDSQIDLQAFEPSSYPLFRQATVHRATVGPGDALYIPRGGWWHHVRSYDVSISVNCYGGSLSILPQYSIDWIKKILLRWGLYRPSSTLIAASGEVRSELWDKPE